MRGYEVANDLAPGLDHFGFVQPLLQTEALHDLRQPRDDFAVPMVDGSHLDDDRHRFVPTFRSTVSCHAPDHDVRFPSHGHRGFNRHSGHFGERAVQICLPCNSN